jgi:D-tyrosyl-tRNA(Tyr) deacylase
MIDGAEVAANGRGFLLLVGVAPTDTAAEVDWMADKVSGLRLFADDQGLMNQDLAAVGGELLVISQFTLYGDASRGRRPSFIGAARPELAVPLYQRFLGALAGHGHRVAAGVFGADMQVSLVNDGPVTLMLEREAA